jgi:hypothetical protein
MGLVHSCMDCSSRRWGCRCGIVGEKLRIL